MRWAHAAPCVPLRPYHPRVMDRPRHCSWAGMQGLHARVGHRAGIQLRMLMGVMGINNEGLGPGDDRPRDVVLKNKGMRVCLRCLLYYIDRAESSPFCCLLLPPQPCVHM